MPSIIQYALSIEAIGNILGATAFTFFPSLCLNHPAPMTATLLQGIGTMVYTLTVPLVFCVPDSPNAAHMRRVVYYTLGTGEACLVALLLPKWLGGADTGFSDKLVAQSLGSFAFLLGWRALVLYVKPEWLEGTSEKAVKKV